MEPAMTPEEEPVRTKALPGKMGRHVAMAAFVKPQPASPKDVTNNGTVSFLELPRGKFLVTNHHVRGGCLLERERLPGLRLAVTGEGYEPPVGVSTAVPVDQDRDLDLAILRFEATM